jgi:hypothetical protein
MGRVLRRLSIPCILFVTVFISAQAQERFRAGELKGFTKLPTEHIIERLKEIPVMRKVEGFVGSKELDRPLEGVLIEIRGPGESVTFSTTKSNHQGQFRFGRKPDGVYIVKLTSNGFRSVVGTISVQRSLKATKAGEVFRIEMLPGV